MVAEVERILLDKGLEYRHSGKDLVIKCLNPDHDDKSPSLRVDKLSGAGHCFSCGFRLNLFKYFDVIGNPVSIHAAKLKANIQRVFSSSLGLQIPKGAQPYTREFKGVPGQVLKQYEAFTHRDYENRIVFPLRDTTGKIVAFIGRHTEPYGKPRYLIAPSDVELPLFPSKLVVEDNTLVIVEGIFDALNLISHGLLNVAAMMGTQGLGSLGKGLHKHKVLQMKVSGVRKIVLLMDGDAAGKKAAELLTPLLEKEQFIVENVELDDGEDPGGLTKDQVDILRKYI